MRRVEVRGLVHGVFGATKQCAIPGVAARRATAQDRIYLDALGKDALRPEYPHIPSISGRLRWSNISTRTTDTGQCRLFSHIAALRDASKSPKAGKTYATPERVHEEPIDDPDEGVFAKSEKATQAAQVNLSARLSKEGSPAGGSSGFSEVWRLIRIAKREVKWLGCTFCDVRCSFIKNNVIHFADRVLVAVAFLLVSSSISMSIPSVARDRYILLLYIGWLLTGNAKDSRLANYWILLRITRLLVISCSGSSFHIFMSHWQEYVQHHAYHHSYFGFGCIVQL